MTASSEAGRSQSNFLNPFQAITDVGNGQTPTTGEPGALDGYRYIIDDERRQRPAVFVRFKLNPNCSTLERRKIQAAHDMPGVVCWFEW